jgi:hypothetical protein
LLLKTLWSAARDLWILAVIFGFRTYAKQSKSVATRYGSRRELRPGGKSPKWGRFLHENTFSPSLLELSNNEDIQRWDRHFLDLSKVDDLSPQPNGFLRFSWYEVARSPALAKVKGERAVLKREIVSALAQVKKHVID